METGTIVLFTIIYILGCIAIRSIVEVIKLNRLIDEQYKSVKCMAWIVEQKDKLIDDLVKQLEENIPECEELI